MNSGDRAIGQKGRMAMESKRTAKRIPPYLSTSEFLQIAGIGSMSLRRYEERGLCVPAYQGEDRYKYWTLDQLQAVSLIDAMRQNGMSLEDIQSVSEQGREALLDGAYHQRADGIRHQRRGLKSIVHTMRKFSDFEPVEGSEGWYLRYLPLRWMALVPMEPHVPEFPDSETFIKAYARLKAVVEVVGWSDTVMFGAFLSMSRDGSTASRYAYMELASPPMPVTTGSMIVDGGCYRVVAPEANEGVCDGDSCFKCARFGREPRKSKGIDEAAEWERAARANPGLWDRTVMAESLAEPYPCGLWSEYTEGRVEGVAFGFEDLRGRKPTPTLRPRLMPHEARLPLGVTACVLPAGVHLCRQLPFERQDSDFPGMLGDLLSLEQHVMTLEDERERAAKMPAEGYLGHDQQKGHYVEPFAQPRSQGDAACEGWYRMLEDDEVRRLVVPTAMALVPDDGFCVTSSNAPLSYDSQTVCQEYQVLVDPGKLAPPPS